MMKYTGTALLNMKCGRKWAKGIGLKLKFGELENYFKSWNEYEIVGLAQER